MGVRDHELNQNCPERPNRKTASRNLVSICPFFIVKDLQTSIMR